MTVMPIFGRAVSKQLVTRATSRLNTPLRVISSQNGSLSQRSLSPSIPVICKHLWTRRTYATAAASTSTTKAARKPRAKSTATKATGTKKTTKKPAAKKTTKKTKSKAKPKPKPKPKRKVLTDLQKEKLAKKETRAKVLEKKEVGLVGKEPKRLPSTAWAVLTSEYTKGASGNPTSHMKDAGTKYRNLSPEEREDYNHTANQNKLKNEQEYKKWVSSYTPLQIKSANDARRYLATVARKAKNNNRLGHHYIKDDRLVGRGTNAFVFFTKDRHASGDFKGMTVAESAKLIGREWKALSASEKKPYNDQAASELARYNEEYRTVYGEAPKTATPKK